MKVEIQVPRMGESITSATIGTILKKSGEKVAMDDEILELETDKVNQLLYAPQAGVLTLNVKPEDVVKIGQTIGVIDSEAAAEAPAEKKEEKPAQLPPQTEKKPEIKPARFTKEDFVSEIKGKEKAPAAPEPLKAAQKVPEAAPQQGERGETRRKMSRIRRVIAEKLVAVQHEAAMLTTFNEIDMSQVIAIREKHKESFLKEHGHKLGFMSFFVKACVSALKEIPDLNSYVEADEIVRREYFDLGVAVGTDRGVIVPVIRNCDHLTFAGIETRIEEYAKKAREGTIAADDLQGGGFTISNGGVYGSLLSTPILNPMQSGILGMHKIVKRPVAIDDEIVIRPMMYVALSYDHRVVDGKEAVTFLVHIKDCLEDPSKLLLDF